MPLSVLYVQASSCRDVYNILLLVKCVKPLCPHQVVGVVLYLLVCACPHRKLVKVQNLERALMHLGKLFGMSMDKVTHHMWPDKRNPDVPSSGGGLPEDASDMVGKLEGVRASFTTAMDAAIARLKPPSEEDGKIKPGPEQPMQNFGGFSMDMTEPVSRYE